MADRTHHHLTGCPRCYRSSAIQEGFRLLLSSFWHWKKPYSLSTMSHSHSHLTTGCVSSWQTRDDSKERRRSKQDRYQSPKEWQVHWDLFFHQSIQISCKEESRSSHRLFGSENFKKIPSFQFCKKIIRATEDLQIFTITNPSKGGTSTKSLSFNGTSK